MKILKISSSEMTESTVLSYPHTTPNRSIRNGMNGSPRVPVQSDTRIWSIRSRNSQDIRLLKITFKLTPFKKYEPYYNDSNYVEYHLALKVENNRGSPKCASVTLKKTMAQRDICRIDNEHLVRRGPLIEQTNFKKVN